MPGILKNTAVLLVVFAAAKWYNAVGGVAAIQNGEGAVKELAARTSDGTEQVQVPNIAEATKSAEENLFRKFWQNHNKTWTVRATGGQYDCRHQEVQSINYTAIELKVYFKAGEHFVDRERFWTFGENGTLELISSWFEQRLRVLYRNCNDTCLVVATEDWERPFGNKSLEEHCDNDVRYDDTDGETTEESKELPEIPQEIKKLYRSKNITRNGRTQEYYSCVPFQWLIVADQNKDDVPSDCEEEYVKAIQDSHRIDMQLYSNETCLTTVARGSL
uniref:Lipocalin n=1 Tax=Rhipicephalus zambeziensis TaxID=60191 RepID=A0A224YNN1_9ACAR